MPAAVGDVYRARLSMTTPSETTFYGSFGLDYQVTAVASGGTTDIEAANGMTSALDDELPVTIKGGMGRTTYRFKIDWSKVGDDEFGHENQFDFDGTSTDDLANGARQAIVMAKVTGLRGRHNQGRAFIPAVVFQSNLVVGGRLTADGITAFTLWGNSWSELTDTASEVSAKLVLMRRSGTPPVLNPVQLQTFEPRTFLGTQRRRRRRLSVV